MSTANAAETLRQATSFSTDYATGSVIISQGATELANYTLAGFTPSNSGNDGLATASAIAPVNNTGTGTADTAILTAGTEIYLLTIGVDIIISDTSFISGVESSVTSLTATFPA